MSSAPEPATTVDPRRPLAGLDASAAGRTVLDLVAGHRQQELAARHRLEYGEPSIWLWRRIVGAAFAFIIVTITWYLVKLPSGLVSDDALPTQTQVATAFNEVRSEGYAGATLAHHAGASLLRLVLGLTIGSLLGVGLGLATGAAPLTRTVIDPITSFFRMVPGLAVAPLVIVWFGAGQAAMVAVVAMTVLWTTMGSASDARMGAARGTIADLRRELIAGMRSALLLAWATVLAVETVLASTGLGALVWFAQDRSDVIMVGIYAAGVIGFLLDSSVRAVQYVVANRSARSFGR